MKKLLILALLVVGCEKDTPTESSVHPLVGVWKGLGFTRTFGEFTQIASFESNGVYVTYVYYADIV